MKRKVSFFWIIFLYFLNIHNLYVSNAAVIEDDGGYKITLAFEEETKQPNKPYEFLQGIEDSFKKLSTEMWRATENTKKQFYIKSIDIIVPNDWTDKLLETIETEKSYHTSDIRVSPKIVRPRVQNKNQCGRPGEFIELPMSFFQNAEGPAYGTHWKSLLHLWARYRWGVWEEHGHPGDYRFPYFYKDEPDVMNWVTTGCSNEPLVGELVNLNGEDGVCPNNTLYPPVSTCRFEPSITENSATSSLMHFPWIESVNEFCNNVSHNIKSPNRHNTFCMYRSTLDVISDCEDSIVATLPNPDDPPPHPKVTFYRSSNRPLLFILMDNGINQVPPDQFVLVKSGLKDLLDGRIPITTRVAIDVFPNLVDPPPNRWSSIKAEQLFFDKFINNHEPNSLTDRDFSKAIKVAVEEMYELNPVSGGVLVILKTGAKGKFDDFIYEHELISIVKRRPVQIFVIEIQENFLTPRINLEAIAKESGGKHLKLTRDSNIANEVNSLIDSVVNVSSQYSIPVTSNDYVVHKENIVPNTKIELSSLHSTLLPIKITLTTKAIINPGNVIVEPMFENPLFSLNFISSKEWNESGSRSRNVLTVIITKTDDHLQPFKGLVLKYTCDKPNTDECNGLLVIYGEDSTQKDVQIRITTSARDNVLDLTYNAISSIPNREFPLSIFAEIFDKGKPLKGFLAVAFVMSKNEGEIPINVLLRDNGQAPDLFPDDGIYSGVFVPEQNGDHKISVRFFYLPESLPDSENMMSWVRLLPVDQNDVTCGNEGSCDAEFPSKIMAMTWDLLKPINVKINESLIFEPRPSPILDLNYIANDDYKVKLEWTAPYIIRGKNETEPVNSYCLYVADTPDEILNGIGTCEQIKVPKCEKPGCKEIYENGTDKDLVRYYAVKSEYNGETSLLSNIIGVFHEKKVTTTTTTPRTTTTTTEAPKEATRAYNILIAIEDGSPEPENILEYIDNLTAELKNLSENMFEATNKRFVIESYDIVFPNTWNTADIDILDIEFTETVNSFSSADIRISTKVPTPRVENPIPCGLPGSYIELPLSFFNKPVEDNFGEPWKAILHLWARYRWGAWDEHGYTGSKRFPYFHKIPRDMEWRPTGCSNPKMEGNIENLNVPGDTCIVDSEFEPQRECRFKPNETNTAKSSLMYLHWVESVDKFCDESSHVKEAPNKQNLFCRYRSVSEIIYRSLDLIDKDELIEDMPNITCNFKKASSKPLFYLLLDDAQTPIPEDGFNKIRTMLVHNILNQINRTITTIGTFPAKNQESNYVDESGPWSQIPTNYTGFEKYPSRATAKRNFGRALYETLNKIIKLKHKPGAIILILKTGIAPDNFDEISYEEEILSSLKEQNIKIYAMEMRSSELRPQIHLQYLAEKSGGFHLQVNNVQMLPTLNSQFIESLLLELNKPQIEYPSAFSTMYKGPIQPDNKLSITVGPEDFSYIHVYITSLTGDILVENVKVELERRIYKFKSKKEWSVTDEGRSRETLYGHRDTRNLGPSATFEVSYKCQSENITECNGFLVVEGELEKPREPEISDPFSVLISTSNSRLNNTVDLSEDRQSTTPFAVFVKLEHNNRPLRRIENITATFYLPNKTRYWTVDLEDNGYGTPDTFEYDGVYSGNFIPPNDGIYNLYVSVLYTWYHESCCQNGNLTMLDSNSIESKLFPIDQNNTHCDIGQCNSKVASKNFARVVEYGEGIIVKNADTWNNKTVPTQILDLTVWALDNYNIFVRWTSPFSIGKEKKKADYFDIRIADKFKELTETRFLNVDKKYNISDKDVTESGEIQQYYYEGKFNTTYYFAVRSCFQGGHCSRPSNIVGTLTREDELPTTTEIPPTTSEEPIVSTLKTSTSTTTKSTKRTTTPKTQRTTSTTKPTTEKIKEDIEHWFEKPEGYITLSVFAVAILLLGIGAIIYVILRNRRATPEGKTQLIQS